MGRFSTSTVNTPVRWMSIPLSYTGKIIVRRQFVLTSALREMGNRPPSARAEGVIGCG